MAPMLTLPFLTPMIFSMAKQFFSRAEAPFLPAWAMMFTLSAAAALVCMSAQAQNPEPPAPADSAAETPAATPRYTASNLERAFNFMDGDHDGKISREEASGFKGVAKYFDRADTDHDNFLSRKEFDAAMNHVKSK
jgi:EF hand